MNSQEQARLIDVMDDLQHVLNLIEAISMAAMAIDARCQRSAMIEVCEVAKSSLGVAQGRLETVQELS